MVSLNMNKRIMISFVLLMVAYIGLAALILQNTIFPRDAFQRVEEQENRMAELKSLVTAMDHQAAAGKNAVLESAAALLSELARAEAEVEAMASYGDATARRLRKQHQEGVQWIDARSGERAIQLSQILEKLAGIINRERVDDLKRLIFEQPDEETLFTLSGRLDTYIQSQAQALGGLTHTLARLPDQKETKLLLERLETLNRLYHARALADALPDPADFREQVERIRDTLSARKLISALDVLPGTEREVLMAVIEDRDRQIKDALSGLVKILDSGTDKAGLVEAFSPLVGLSALPALKHNLSQMPDPESLAGHLNDFPDTAPVLSASALMSMIPGSEIWQGVLKSGVFPDRLDQARESLTLHIQSDPFSAEAVKAHLIAPDPGKFSTSGLFGHLSIARTKMETAIAALNPKGDQGGDPAHMAGETAGSLKSFRQAFEELNRSSRRVMAYSMAGFLLLMLICAFYLSRYRDKDANDTPAEKEPFPADLLTEFTRFGNFETDSEGHLVSSHGHIVQGWRVSGCAPIQGVFRA